MPVTVVYGKSSCSIQFLRRSSMGSMPSSTAISSTMRSMANVASGRPEATFAIERIVDEMAVELGMDPMELRRKNWIEHDDFPYTTVTGITYDSGNYEEATDKALALMGWDDLRREQADRIARGDPVRLGLGISTYTELCGWAPSRLLGVLAYA